MTIRNGHQCSRQATLGGFGFCWQHAPVKDPRDREILKGGSSSRSNSFAVAALVLSAMGVLFQIADFALTHLTELLGVGDPRQTRAKSQLELKLFGDAPRYPELPSNYSPGSRVDWRSLLLLVQRVEMLRDSPSEIELEKLEQDFLRWFSVLNESQRSALMSAIEEGATR